MQAEIRNLTNEEYHASDGLSSSALKLILQSPKKYQWEYILGNKKEETEAMIFGTQFHMFCLEPELFEKTYYIVQEKIDKRTKRYQELLLIAESQQKEIISDERVYELTKIRESVFNCSISRERKIKAERFLTGGVAEQSIFWKDEESGLILKTRPDCQNHSASVIIDLKTTKNACIDAFSLDIYKRGYFIQAAIAVDGVKALTGKEMGFLNLAVEKEAPYCAQAYSYADDVIEIGRIEYRRAINIYLKCNKENYWPSYEDDMVDISIPHWAENKINYYEEN